MTAVVCVGRGGRRLGCAGTRLSSPASTSPSRCRGGGGASATDGAPVHAAGRRAMRQGGGPCGRRLQPAVKVGHGGESGRYGRVVRCAEGGAWRRREAGGRVCGNWLVVGCAAGRQLVVGCGAWWSAVPRVSPLLQRDAGLDASCQGGCVGCAGPGSGVRRVSRLPPPGGGGVGRGGCPAT